MKHISFRCEDSLRERIERYQARAGGNFTDATRRLLLQALDEQDRGVVDVRDLVPAIHERLGQLARTSAKSPATYKTLMVTLLECVMLLRQQVAGADPKALTTAQRNAKTTFEALEKEGTV